MLLKDVSAVSLEGTKSPWIYIMQYVQHSFVYSTLIVALLIDIWEGWGTLKNIKPRLLNLLLADDIY